MPVAPDRFRAILARDACTNAAPIFDPLSARIADMTGWEVCKLSGSFGKFANLAVPDGVPLANASDLVDLCWRIKRVCDAPLIVDADDGGGNALTVARTVRELEMAGAAAIEIEDNLVPAAFGRAERRHALMLSEEQVGKLEAAVAARHRPETVIVARTSALSELPRSEALRRIAAYSRSGAEALMFPELPGGAADLPEIASVTTLPLFVLGLPSDTFRDRALIAASRLRIRFLPHIPYRMAVQAITAALHHLAQGGDLERLGERQAPEGLLRKVDRTAETERWQGQFLRSPTP